MPHASDLRKGRYSEPGRIYLITTVTRDRRPIFRDIHPARLVIQTLRQEDLIGHTQTLAFVVMPDHLHWLMQLEPGADLPTVVRAVKAISARRIGIALWQPGFHDHALRQKEDLREIARYVIANPVRAGLVKSIGAYPHWGAMWL